MKIMKYFKSWLIIISAFLPLCINAQKNIPSGTSNNGGGGNSFETERFFIYSHDLIGVKYSLYKKTNKTDVRTNLDGTNFYKSQLILEIDNGGKISSYIISDDLYLLEGKSNAQTPCMALDLKDRKIYVFSNSKKAGSNNVMLGTLFVSSLDNIKFDRISVMKHGNTGWFPYFTYSKGILELQHFGYEMWTGIIGDYQYNVWITSKYEEHSSFAYGNGWYSYSWGRYTNVEKFERQWQNKSVLEITDSKANSELLNTLDDLSL